jgi:hypothetical protein
MITKKSFPSKSDKDVHEATKACEEKILEIALSNCR